MKINDVDIDAANWPTPQMAAVHELLRQRALELELLGADASADVISSAIEQVLQREVAVPEPSAEECRRWYDMHTEQYRNGELVHARHILFQITPGAPVGAIRSVAEAMLTELRAHPELFSERARDKSNCPSAAQDGQLGQLQRGSTVPEFERAIFDSDVTGVLPDLVHTRHGFHIVAVDERIAGEQLPFEVVKDDIARQLRSTSEERALGQYVRMLAGQADVRGVELDAATSPLVQ